MKKIILTAACFLVILVLTSVNLFDERQIPIIESDEPIIIEEPKAEIIPVATTTQAVEVNEPIIEITESIELIEDTEIDEIVETPDEPEPIAIIIEQQPIITEKPNESIPNGAIDGDYIYILGFGWIFNEGGGGYGEQSYGEGDWNKMIGY